MLAEETQCTAVPQEKWEIKQPGEGGRARPPFPQSQWTWLPISNSVASNSAPHFGRLMAISLSPHDRHNHSPPPRANAAPKMDYLLPGAQHRLALGHGHRERVDSLHLPRQPGVARSIWLLLRREELPELD
jgi:hypothetical protein